MKQIIILAVVFVSAFGAKLNQYLPPRPETHNIQFQPPELPNSGGQPFDIGNLLQPFRTSKVSEQSGQSPGPFEQFAQKTSFDGPQFSLELGQLTQKSVNGIPEQSSIPFGQKNTFNTNNGSPTRQYLTPINKDTSGQSYNSIVVLQNPSSDSNRFKAFGPKSEAQNTNSFGQFPNQRQVYNGPSINGLNQPTREFNGQYPGNVGPQSAPIGLIRSEINPDVGDGHYSYLYETENGITAQEEGYETNKGKSAQGSFSYTSPEGEQITLEYTADANGFVPKGSHVPEIPEAIAKSIELNKAAEARREYNEGSYRDEYNDESNGNQGKATFNSFKVPNAYGNQNNVYQNSEPARNNNVADRGTFSSEENKQFSPIVQRNNAIPSYDQKINGAPETLGHQSYETKTPFGQKRIQQYNKGLQSPFGQQTNGPKTFIVPQTNGPKTSLGQNNGGNNGYQYSAPGNTNFANQSTLVSEENKQVSPIGQQNNVVSSYDQIINGVPETIRRQSYESQTPFGQKGTQQYNNNLQLPFEEQKNGPKTSFGQHNGPRYSALGKTSFSGQGTFASEQPTPFGQQNVPSTSYKQQNRAPSTYFEQQNNELKSVSKSENNGYQFPGQEQNFATQHNKPFRTQISTTSTQFAPKYEAPGKAPPTNNFSFQKNESKGPSGQYGTVQDNKGGYKY